MAQSTFTRSDMSLARESKLFEPVQIGNITLKHRIVMAPMARTRNALDRVPRDQPLLYYTQRASTPGTLLITEACTITEKAAGFDNVPGIWSEEQIQGWTKITQSVHKQGSYIFLQLWAIGRLGSAEILARSGNTVISASAIPLKGRDMPRPLATEEVEGLVQDYATAAKNAMRAGFDGVEIHGANGYLIDQFLNVCSNERTDKYGGSIENRARFALEVIDAVSEAIGENRVAIRISPWSYYFGMRGTKESPVPQFSYLVKSLAERHPNMAYLHFIESGTSGDAHDAEDEVEEETNEFARKLWQPRPFISAGGYSNNIPGAIKVANEDNMIVSMGRAFLANPDLPERIRRDIPFNKYDRPTFYVAGEDAVHGYTDYPFATQAGVEIIAAS